MQIKRFKKRAFRIAIANILLISILISCKPFSTFQNEFHQDIPLAEVVFEVQIPKPLDNNEILYLEILDEVTGLSFNPIRFEMQAKDDLNYFIRIPITIDSIVKYRFAINGNYSSVEYSSIGKQIRYRMHLITGPEVVRDIIVAWHDYPYSNEVGEIQGIVFDSKNDSPIPNMMIIVSGMKTFSAADGSFHISDIPVGQHTLVAYSIDGAYIPFQQDAIVAVNSITPAIFSMEPSNYVNITFNVTPPNENIPGAPIRLIGNLYTIGNTFSDLRGGMSVLASRAPVMNYQSDGSYSLTISLPSGFDLRYKYTLGDGFWNAEYFDDGSMRIRQIIIPDHNVTVKDSIATWHSINQSPITFNIKVPPDTPANDNVSLQLNPNVWTEPLPIWPLGDNKWTFTLYNPINQSDKNIFRLCLNEQCGIADDLDTDNENNYIHSLDSSSEVINYEVKKWAFSQYPNINLNLNNENVIKRDSLFFAGIEFSNIYHPSYQPYIGKAFIDVGVDNANWLFLRPSWSINEKIDTDFYLKPGFDPYWSDILQTISYAHMVNLNIAIFPSLNYHTSFDKYWENANLGYLWWHQWFDSYSKFILNFVDLAALTNSQAIILDLNEIYPLIQQANYNVPDDINDKWQDLLDSIKTRFDGDIILAIPYSQNLSLLPDWVNKIDAIYLLFSPPLSANQTPSVDELTLRIGQILDNEIYPFYSSNSKPVILGINYPSVDGSAMGCISSENNCLEYTGLDINETLNKIPQIDLKEQADIYLSFFRAINQRPWIGGIVSRGYYPPLALHDYSSSIHGKPAETILGFWFSKLFPIN